ncbi:MAG: PKD domain-containing protein [Candidatus Thermoplasmatota archaeon]
MRSQTVALLLVGLLTAGCFGGGGGGGKGGDGASSESASATSGKSVLTFTYSPAVPRAGEAVTFTATVSNLGTRTVESWSWAWGDGGTGKGSPATHAFAAAGESTVKLTATLSDGRTLTKSQGLFVLNPGEEGTPGNETGSAPAPPPPGIFDCAGTTVNETYSTHGTDDSLPGFAWATLKTGFRFAVVWSSEDLTTGSLTYTIGNGTARTVSETAPTRLHLIVVDGITEGRTLCFTASMGGTTTPLHAVRTVNAMTSYVAGTPHGSYSMNFLVLSNEQGDQAEVEAGLESYGNLLWDATDGWVRAGAVLLIQGNAVQGNIGWPTCYLAGGIAFVCENLYDVLVTNAAAPQGAASTYAQGIRDPDAAIWMNQYHQAMPGPLSLDDFGAVLTHEVGHYAFNMADLYGDNTVVTTECFDSSTGISIMAGSRDASEFDDPATPCPNQPSGYTTSWEFLQGQFKGVPDRPSGPEKGPDGNGGIFLTRTYRGV